MLFRRVKQSKGTSFCEHIRDIKTAYQVPRKVTGETEKKEALAEFFKTTLPEKLKAIEGSLDEADFVIGDKISLADVTLYGLINFFDNREGILAALPDLLKKKHQAVESNLKVKACVASRPETPF